jgi:hypothetical protein
MTAPATISVLIVDRSNAWGLALRERLRGLGLQVYSARTRGEAVVCAACHKIDAAVFDTTEDWAPDLHNVLGSLDVPYIYGATPLSDGHVRLTGCDEDVYGALDGVKA